jgi:hypothetical protein
MLRSVSKPTTNARNGGVHLTTVNAVESTSVKLKKGRCGECNHLGDRAFPPSLET